MLMSLDFSPLMLRSTDKVRLHYPLSDDFSLFPEVPSVRPRGLEATLLELEDQATFGILEITNFDKVEGTSSLELEIDGFTNPFST